MPTSEMKSGIMPMEKLRGTRASQDKRERDDNNARGRKVAIKLPPR